MSTDYQYYVILLFCFSYLYSKTDSQFTEAPDSPIVKCFGDTANVRWNFSVMNIQSIQWFDGSTEMMIKFAASAPTYSNSYNSSVVEYVADAEILLKALTTSSTGSYSCTLFYTTGSPITNTIDLIVYDKFSSGLICQYVGGAITCTKPDSSVSLNATDDQGSVIDINKPSTSGNYTICMYGGAIECRDTFPTCTIVEVIIQGVSPGLDDKCSKLHYIIFVLEFTGTFLGIIILFLYVHKKDHEEKEKIYLNIWTVITSLILDIFIGLLCVYITCIENELWYITFFFVGLGITLLVAVPAYKYMTTKDTQWLFLLVFILILTIIGLIFIVLVLIICYCTCCMGKSHRKKDGTPRKDGKHTQNDEPSGNDKLDTQNDEPSGNDKLDTQNDEPSGNDKLVVPDCLSSIVVTIDHECPSSLKWINENAEELKSLVHAGNRLPKISTGIKPVLKDSGIYQCVRTFAGQEGDKINIVFHVSALCPVFLQVHPSFWATKSIEDLDPVQLKNLVSIINKDDENIGQAHTKMSVEWKYRCTSYEEYKTLPGKERLKLRISTLDRSGEYRCTVELGKREIQTYFFLVIFLDQDESGKDVKKNVVGVPSCLISTGDHLSYFIDVKKC